jgi:hypothetical protein
MADANRLATSGEAAMIRSVFGIGIPIEKVRIHSERWMPVFPNDRAMAPNGHIYFPGDLYHEDFSCTIVRRRAVFIHESTHLYQYYILGWSVIMRGPFDPDYSYRLVKDQPFSRYGLEQMGMLAEHYYTLREGGSLTGPYSRYSLDDYAPLLTIR